MARHPLRLGRRAIAVSLGTVAVVATIAGPAAAHGGTPAPDAAYYRAHLTAISPNPPGITASVDPHAEWIEVTYAGRGELIIYGYGHEPYLRITAAGVEENELSPATYINRSMFADLPAGTSAQEAVAPSWHLAATTRTARWHDHRIHWMGQTRQPSVAANPTHPHVVGSWVVHASANDTPFDIRGTLNWIGKPGSGLPTHVWLLLAAGNLPLIVGAAAWHLRSRRRHRQQPTPAPA